MFANAMVLANYTAMYKCVINMLYALDTHKDTWQLSFSWTNKGKKVNFKKKNWGGRMKKGIMNLTYNKQKGF